MQHNFDEQIHFVHSMSFISQMKSFLLTWLKVAFKLSDILLLRMNYFIKQTHCKSRFLLLKHYIYHYLWWHLRRNSRFDFHTTITYGLLKWNVSLFPQKKTSEGHWSAQQHPKLDKESFRVGQKKHTLFTKSMWYMPTPVLDILNMQIECVSPSIVYSA